MPSICTQLATVGLHLTVPGMRVLQLNNSLNHSKKMLLQAGNRPIMNVYIILFDMRGATIEILLFLSLFKGCL